MGGRTAHAPISRWMTARAGVALAAVATLVCSTACSTADGATDGATDAGSTRVVQVAASINAWGSILEQLGGTHVHATSIITNPDTDPHDYEPTAADARTIADSQLFVENGIGYDPWAERSLAASPDPSRLVLDVGHLVGVPDDGNPHRWYSPSDVTRVAASITADLTRLDPTDAGYFAARHRAFVSRGLARYDRLIAQIKARYSGVEVGASESIFEPLAGALGLDLVTPPDFLKAISEGTDPSPQDLATITHQIDTGTIKVYVYNSQNATPDVAAQVKAAKAHDIPVTTITETLSPATATFQQWQCAQLAALERALATAARR